MAKKRRRHANPMRKWAAHTEWCYERQGLPVEVLMRKLKVSRRSIWEWDRATRPIPHWAPQVLRLQRMEAAVVVAQITGQDAVPLKGLLYIDPPAASVRSVGASAMAA